MTLTTAYYDTFGRNVTSGFGTSSSGSVYSLVNGPTPFNVVAASNIGTIAPATLADFIAYVDRQTSDLDITGQFSLNKIPTTNLATTGFVGKLSTSGNYYNATMMVATSGAISLRFSKNVSGGVSTIATVSTGLTYVAAAIYNLRVAMYWSNTLQATVLQSKLWASGATEPGGWMATATDTSFTQYTAGTGAGVMARDESTTLGTVTATIKNVVARTYAMPMPVTTDPMCSDPDYTYPKQTVLQTLATAADKTMATFDASATLAANYPRVRVSVSNYSLVAKATDPSAFHYVPFTTTEFNVGTPTNLSYNGNAISLSTGIWALMFEIQLAQASAASLEINAAGSLIFFKSSPTVSNYTVGGTGHCSGIAWVTDPVTPSTFSAFFTLQSGTYTITYAALSAIKISDYFV